MSEGDIDEPATCVQPLKAQPSIRNIFPVIITAIDKPHYFSSLDFAGIKNFVGAIVELVNSVKNVEVASGGDLFVFPVDFSQEQILFSLTCINGINVRCSITKSETEFRGVIFGVPVDESENSILALLKDQTS